MAREGDGLESRVLPPVFSTAGDVILMLEGWVRCSAFIARVFVWAAGFTAAFLTTVVLEAGAHGFRGGSVG